jgi:flagellar basal-body rod protein FlgG
MMRALWTGASGMIAQQTNVDLISNNLANVNTFGYKKERLEFQSLLYQTMKRANLDPATQTGTPTNLQVGLGVRPLAVSRFFETGNVQVTEGKTDFAIQGDGFFVINTGDVNGQVYTKDGSFKVGVLEDGSTMLVTSDGWPVLDTEGENIIFPPEVMVSNVSVDSFGNISYLTADNETADLGQRIDVVQFSNTQGLEAVGSNFFKETIASGPPVQEASGETAYVSNITQGTLEMANVQVAEEMVRLIVAQRAYELNSKVITTSDSMLENANNLKR